MGCISLVDLACSTFGGCWATLSEPWANCQNARKPGRLVGWALELGRSSHGKSK